MTRSIAIRSAFIAIVATVLVACAGGAASPGPASSGGPAGSGGSLAAGQLRVRIVEQLGPRWWCDPDFYPLARADEEALAVEHFGDMQAEGDVFRAVVAQLGLAGATTFSDAQKLAIYRLWKEAASFPFDSLGNGRYRFEYVAQPVEGASEGTHTSGTIGADGAITVEQRTPAGQPNCPICLARGTRIDTPHGSVTVEDLVLGESIWTLDSSGRRIAGVVIALGSTIAPADHHVIQLSLADGRTVTASPGHPLADGRRLGDLQMGDAVDGSLVVGLETLPYSGGETFDLVASGPTGIYLSDGIPLGTTLR